MNMISDFSTGSSQKESEPIENVQKSYWENNTTRKRDCSFVKERAKEEKKESKIPYFSNFNSLCFGFFGDTLRKL